MIKRLMSVCAVFVAVMSCNSLKQPITFQKETGFQQSEGYYYTLSDVEIMDENFDFGQNKIRIKSSQLYELNGVKHWKGKTIDKEGHELPMVSFYEEDSTGFHSIGMSDRHGFFSIEIQNPNCNGFYLDESFLLDYSLDFVFVRIKRGFALGEEEINIETDQAYVSRGIVHWQGKTVDEEGNVLPYVSLYEVDTTAYKLYDDVSNDSFLCCHVGTSDEHGIFSIKSHTKTCQGFFADGVGYIGTLFFIRHE